MCLSLASVASRGISSTVFSYVFYSLPPLLSSASPRWLRVMSSHDPRFSLYRLFHFSDVHCLGSLYSAIGTVTPALLLRSYPRPVTTPITGYSPRVVRCTLYVVRSLFGDAQECMHSGSSKYSFVSVTAVLSILSPDSSLACSQIPAVLTPIAVARPRPLPARKIDKAGRQERDYQRTRHG